MAVAAPVTDRAPSVAQTEAVRGARHTFEVAAIIRGMTVALAGAVVGGGFGFVFLVVMAQMLHPGQFGIVVLAVNVLMAGAAVTIAGVDYAAIRFVAAARMPSARRGAMRASLRVVVPLNLAIALLVLVFADPIARHGFGQPDFTPVLRLVAAVLPLTVLAQMLSACLSGLEQARGELVRKVVEQGARVVLGVIAVLFGFGAVGVALGLLGAAALAAVALTMMIRRSVLGSGRVRPMRARSVVAFAWPQALSNGATQLWTLVLLALLARSADAATVGIFGAAFALAQLPLLVYNAFTYRFSPVIARLTASGKDDALEQLLKSVTRWVVTLALPFHAVAIVLPAFLLGVYGSSYRSGATALSVMAVASLLNAGSGPVERALVMAGRVKTEMTINVAATVVVVGASAVLVPRYGLVAAAVMIVVYTVARNGAKLYVVHRTMRMSTLSRSLLRPVAAGAVASGGVLVADHLAGLGGTLRGGALLAGALVATYALLLLLPVGMSRADRRTLLLALRPSGAHTS